MRVLGLMSGTSMDGIDVALVDITENPGYSLQVAMVDGQTFDYDPALRSELLAVADGQPLSFAAMADLDDRVALAFAHAALQVVERAAPPPDWIASHGQTVYHRPPEPLCGKQLGYTLQLGRGATIAQQTGIGTISNFRQADIAQGGQGAPMVSMLDWLCLTHPTHPRAVQNIGGISNVTYLPAQGTPESVLGFDNAPGNVLIDRAAQLLYAMPYDRGGALAAQGTIDTTLWRSWLNHPFFTTSPPKSTGRELFDFPFLQRCIQAATDRGLTHPDILATLTELTAQGIVDSYHRFLPQFPNEILLCGGGTKNAYLVERLRHIVPQTALTSTDAYGIPSDFKEAIAFALLGYLRVHHRSGNLPAVTGARQSVPLGEIWNSPVLL